MTIEEKLHEAMHLINTLRVDAEMALSGEWNCSSEEGKETGFTAQIDLIDNFYSNIK